MLRRTRLGLVTLLAASLGAGAASAGTPTAGAGTDRIITGSGETPPAFVQTGPNMYERYEIATARSADQPGGTDGVITGAEQPLVPLARSRSVGYETSVGDNPGVSDYPGASGYLPDGRVDP